MSSSGSLIELGDGTTIQKGSNGEFVVDTWGSVNIRDSQGQRLPINEILKDTPMMMAHRPKVHLSHTDTEVGDLIDVRKATKTVDGKKEDAIRVKYGLYGTRRFHKATRAKVEKGDLGMVSIKGFAYGKPTYEPSKAGVTEVLHDLECVTFAICKQGVNPEATNVSVNGVEVAKADDIELLKQPAFYKNVRAYMADGLSYSQAMSTSKELYNDQVVKEMIFEKDDGGRDGKPKTEEERKEAHKKKYGSEDVPPRGTGKGKKVKKGDNNMTDEEIEAMEKELKDLRKSIEEKDGKIVDLEKTNGDLSTERDGLKVNLEKAAQDPPEADPPAPTGISKEAVVELLKEDRVAFKKEILENKDEFLKAIGYSPIEGGAEAPFAKGFSKSIESEGLEEFWNVYAKARDHAMNEGLDDVTSVEDLEKATQTENYGGVENE